MSYVFTHNDTVFSPEGKTDLSANQANQHNQDQEKKELEWLKTGPQKILLYVKLENDPKALNGWVRTWLGTDIAPAQFSARRYMGFGSGFGSYRRSMSCWIFGKLYHGWYYESSGDYCRLTLAKRQGRAGKA